MYIHKDISNGLQHGLQQGHMIRRAKRKERNRELHSGLMINTCQLRKRNKEKEVKYLYQNIRPLHRSYLFKKISEIQNEMVRGATPIEQIFGPGQHRKNRVPFQPSELNGEVGPKLSSFGRTKNPGWLAGAPHQMEEVR